MLWHWIIELDKIWAPRSRAWFARQFTRDHRLDWIIIGTFGALALWLWASAKLDAPVTVAPGVPPGSSIGALGALAMVMTFSKPSPFQRSFLIVLAIGLFLLEYNIIEKDRAAQQASTLAQAQKIINANTLQTQTILHEDQTAFAGTFAQFGKLGTKSQQIEYAARAAIEASKSNLRYLNAEGAFPYIAAQRDGPPFRLIIWNAGDYPLTGVSVVIYRTTIMPWEEQSEDIGTIPPHGHRDLRATIMPDMKAVTYTPGDKNYFDSYWIFMTTQSGLVTQVLEFRPSLRHEGWAQRYWVQREGCKSSRSQCPQGPNFKDPSQGDTWSDERPLAAR